MVTDFGKFADPLADKLLTTVAFIYMMRDACAACGALHHSGPRVRCLRLRMVAAGAKDGKVIAATCGAR